MKHLVSHQGQQSGPFSLDEVVAKVRAKELELFDYIYDLEKDDWVLLMEFAPLAARLKSNKPGKPPQTAEVAAVETPLTTVSSTVALDPHAHAITEWFVLKGENRFGPFAYNDLVKMLQQKVLFPFDFVWHTSMKEWSRLAELSEFNSDAIRKLHTEGSDVFVQRRFKRSQFASRVIINDGVTLWRGQGLEISKGGVGLTMHNTLIVPGQQLNVHFHKHEEWPTFNAICEVVSKKFVNDARPMEYGLRFLSLSQEAQDEIYKKVA
jgi:hypothetical protein